MYPIFFKLKRMAEINKIKDRIAFLIPDICNNDIEIKISRFKDAIEHDISLKTQNNYHLVSNSINLRLKKMKDELYNLVEEQKLNLEDFKTKFLDEELLLKMNNYLSTIDVALVICDSVNFS